MSKAARAPACQGTAAGVPYIAFAPASGGQPAPLVAVLHLMDPPRTEQAMAAALPLAGVDAWRVYLGLPMFGERAPAGGPEEIMRLAMEDALLNLIGPVVEQAAAELPGAVEALRAQLPVEAGPIGLVGGSAGAAAVLLALAESDLSVAAAVLVNPASRAKSVVEAGERRFGMTYAWSEASRVKADQLDFVRRAGEIAARNPQVPILFVAGEDDDPAFISATEALKEALSGQYGSVDEIRMVTVRGLGHALADEPGLEPTPQSPGAAMVDREVAGWMKRYLAAGRSGYAA